MAAQHGKRKIEKDFNEMLFNEMHFQDLLNDSNSLLRFCPHQLFITFLITSSHQFLGLSLITDPCRTLLITYNTESREYEKL